MEKFISNFKIWFRAARGYSLPMSVFSYLIIFSWCMKEGGRISYGLIAMLGVLVAHLGTNLFDDFLDFKCGIPKQDCKRIYFQNGILTLKQLFIASSVCFLFSSFIGLFFVINIGLKILIPCIIAGSLCLLYPKLNHIALGEIALILTYGPILYYGVCLVMGCDFNGFVFLLSLLAGIITMILLDAHAFMDFDTDKSSGKKTLLVMLKTKERALNFLMSLIYISYGIIIFLVCFKAVSWIALLGLLTTPLTIKLYRFLKDFIINPDPNLFLRNFIIARNISVILEITLAISICCK